MSVAQIIIVVGLATGVPAVCSFWLMPEATIRWIVRRVCRVFYRMGVYGLENLPQSGGGLLVANHVSWMDAVFLLLASPRPLRMLGYASYMNNWKVRRLARIFKVIPITGKGGPKALVQSLQAAREAIAAGELVCIFAEGSITRTGHLQPFQPGLLRIVRGTAAPVIPVYLGGLWGSIFSYSEGKLIWKRPRRWPYPVSVTFGEPLAEPDDVHQVRLAVQKLGAEAMERDKGRELIPPRRFLRKCRRRLFRPKVADSSGTELTGGKLLTASLVFKRLLERGVIAGDEEMVGVLLPPSVGGVIANTSLTLMRRVTVNLNYTLSNEDANYCIRQAGIRHVVTSRRFLEKRPFELDAELVFLEDLKEQATGWDKLVSALQAYSLPAAVLERMLGLTQVSPDDLITVIFTSGSTGEPKGVMLSHHNVMSNLDGVNQLFRLTDRDVLLGILPFFHSFGFTGTLWLALTLDPKGVYHFNPLDARTVGKLCEQHGVTITLATPTFLRSYLKRCTPEQLEKLDTVIVGAEKMPLDLAAAFKEKFGVEPSEGYGTTELSPVVAVNIPEHRLGTSGQRGTKLGTVGRPFPGVAVKVVDPDTREDLGTNREGLLLIKGPNVMRGYLNQPAKTAEAIKDGWYNTGDFAKIDDEGFIEITGRQSRFSKIGGEMVPHVKVEELLNHIIGDQEDDEPDVKLAVTSVPHETKGERLVVLHRALPRSVDEIRRELSEANVPNLWIPSRESFVEVDEIPVLGTGKLDLKGVKQLALEKFTPQAVER